MVAPAPEPPWLRALMRPAATFRPQPLWIWNGDVSPERITEMLAFFASAGMGGVFVHPRPGLVTEYLSEAWFDLWAHALAECKRLGLGCHIYDENSYPSGFAGGHVVSRNPGLIARGLEPRVFIAPPPEGLALWGTFAITPDGRPTPTPARARDASPQYPVVGLAYSPAPASAWHGGFPWVDLLRPETTREFLRVTHEEYRRRFGADFGKSVGFAFADEPCTPSGPRSLAMSRHLLGEFFADHGYALEDHLGALCFGGEEAAGVRHDYHATVNRLFLENYVGIMDAWCREHGIAFTGHFMEHRWPDPLDTPDPLAALSLMEVPGNDLLGFQIDPANPEKTWPYLRDLRELASAVNQMGRARSLVESAGGGGYDAGPALLKAADDTLLAFGVNLINPHLAHQTLAGARKYDWPHTLSDHSDWMREYRAHADHVGRVASVLSSGQEIQRILVLQPTTTAWAFAVPDCFAFGPGEKPSDRCASMRERHAALLRDLAVRGVDFDLGSEWVMARFGGPEGPRFRVGQRVYDLVIIPPETANLCPETVRALGEYLSAGGMIIGGNEPPHRVAGRPSAAPAELANAFPSQWKRCADRAEIVALAAAAVPPRLSGPGGTALPANLLWRRVETPDGVLVFFANPWATPLRGEVELEGSTCSELCTREGAVFAFPSEPDGNRQRIRLDLPPRGHLLLALDRPAAPRAALGAAARGVVRFVGAERESENVLALDYCDVTCRGRSLRSVPTISADNFAWRALGLEGNPWRVSIQFRKTFLEHPFAATDTLAVEYAFEVAEDLAEAALATLRFAVERPWLYAITINGEAVDQARGERWFDEEIRAFPAGPSVRRGANRIRLAAHRAHALAEIMPVYILGDFAPAAAEKGFRIENARPVGLGDWSAQGMPFYAGTVVYRFAVEVAGPADHVRIRLPGTPGPAARIRWDDREASLLGEPWACVIPGPISPGTHTLEVALRGHLKNLLGPHFSDGLPGGWSWEEAPKQEPSGSVYQFRPLGLGGVPLVG